jgi:two-component system chemotaxis response regulator CheY
VPTDTALFAGLTALLVDDEPFSRKVLERMLLSLGFAAVVEAENGRAAARLIRSNSDTVHLVLSDFIMPEATGLQLLQAIRTGVAGPQHDLPLVLVSGHADRRLVDEAMTFDCDGLLIKPTSRDDVRDRLTRALSGDRTIRSADYYTAIALGDAAAPVPEEAFPDTAQPPDLLPLDEISEGMVLASDIFARGGDLLLPAGRVLDRKILTMLGDLGLFDKDLKRLPVRPPARGA